MNNICETCEWYGMEECTLYHNTCGTCTDFSNYREADWIKEHDAKIRADAIEEFDRICEEARSHKFGVCDAEFVIDVIKAKVKEQLKKKKNG